MHFANHPLAKAAGDLARTLVAVFTGSTDLRVGIRTIASMSAPSVHGHLIVFQWRRFNPLRIANCMINW